LSTEKAKSCLLLRLQEVDVGGGVVGVVVIVVLEPALPPPPPPPHAVAPAAKIMMAFLNFPSFIAAYLSRYFLVSIHVMLFRAALHV
jgi:hypothetical protein